MSKWIVDIHGEIEGDYDLICKAENSIPLDKVKQAREEIKAESYAEHIDGADCDDILIVELRDVLEILDKLIEREE